MRIFFVKFFLVIFFFSIDNPLFAQTTPPVTYKHITYWSRITVAKVLAKKWELSGEYQHRRQNYEPQTDNLLKYPLLHSIRLRARYALTEQFTITLLPFTYFYATPLLGSEKDLLRKPDKELRFAMQAELRQKVGKFEVFNRLGIEKRFIKRPPDSLYRQINRIRTRLLVEMPVVNKQTNTEILRPYTSGEIFLNAGKTVFPTQIFEHVRFIGGIRLPVHPHLRVDAGYQYSYRLRRTGYEKDMEHTIYTYLIFQL